MSTKDEALKLALEALEDAKKNHGLVYVTELCAIREALAEQPEQQCRTDGRCQYAIDSGAEGMGHCPKGKCIMPAQQQEQGAKDDADIYEFWARTKRAEQPAQQQEPVANDRIIKCAKRLVEHADFQLGGVLSADSKAKDIPSRAVSQVKSRHLAALRDALANTSPPAQRKPLTDDEIVKITSDPCLYIRGGDYRIDIARAIEAAHGIKENT